MCRERGVCLGAMPWTRVADGLGWGVLLPASCHDVTAPRLCPFPRRDPHATCKTFIVSITAAPPACPESPGPSSGTRFCCLGDPGLSIPGVLRASGSPPGTYLQEKGWLQRQAGACRSGSSGMLIPALGHGLGGLDEPGPGRISGFKRVMLASGWPASWGCVG